MVLDTEDSKMKRGQSVPSTCSVPSPQWLVSLEKGGPLPQDQLHFLRKARGSFFSVCKVKPNFGQMTQQISTHCKEHGLHIVKKMEPQQIEYEFK